MTSPDDWTRPSDSTLVEDRVDDGVAILTLCAPPTNTYRDDLLGLEPSALHSRWGASNGRCRPLSKWAFMTGWR